jgi:hypothetical protein
MAVFSNSQCLFKKIGGRLVFTVCYYDDLPLDESPVLCDLRQIVSSRIFCLIQIHKFRMEKSPSAISTQITDEHKDEKGKTEDISQINENEALSKEKIGSKEDIVPKEEMEAKEEIVSLPKEGTASISKGEASSLQKEETGSLVKEETVSLPKEEIGSLPKGEVSSVNIIDPQQKSEVDLNTLLEIGSEDVSDSKQDESEIFYPFGEDHIPLTPKIIDDKKKLLGIIRLYWPFSPDIR